MIVDPRHWDIDAYRRAYREGASVTDVIDSVLALLDDSPPAVLIGPPLHALARADVRRLVLVAPDTLALYGVPFVVKDNIDVAGVPTTAGCPGFAYVADQDATLVAQLRAAGAVVVGKANLDQFATGLVGTRSPYGTPANVLDATLVPGGSSSGSAVAVALGLVPFSIGTDTAGSGRVPAAMNGIVGLKPTVGSVSSAGVVPAVRRLDCPSIFARSVGDAALVASVVRGAGDSSTRVPQPTAPFRDPPVVGIPRHWPEAVELAPLMAGWFDEALARLTTLGVELREVDIGPLLDVGAMLYGSAIVAERTAAVGDAVTKELDGLDPTVADIIARGFEMTATDAYRAERELVRRRFAARHVFDDIDVLALPTTPHLATIDDVAADPVGRNAALGALTTFANLLDLTCLVTPMAPGIPAGLQLIAPAWCDDELARVAEGFESGAIAVPPRQTATLVVVGAHLRGQPLHHQLTERRASFVAATTTSPDYRLYALADTEPAKPGLVRVGHGTGASIEVEVWSMSHDAFGSFVQQVPPPLCIGTVTLADGSSHKGFLCEPRGLAGAIDITALGGWRAFRAH